MKRSAILMSLAILALLAGACARIPEGASTSTRPLPFISPLPLTSALSPVEPGATAAPAPEVVLTYHIEGGIAGFCDDLVAWLDGQAAVTPCGSAAATSGQLTVEEAARLAAWRAQLQSFAASTSDPATADAMQTQLRFAGDGSRPASEEERLAIAGFAQQVLLRLRQSSLPSQTFITGLAAVESVEVQVLEQSPLSILVIARGNLPDGCTSIGDTSWNQVGDTFEVTITTVRPEEMMCTQALVPFEETVMIESGSALPPGLYTVDVNGVSAQFEIP